MSTTPLEARRRRAARLALYGGLAALVAVLFLLTRVLERVLAHRAEWGEVDWEALPEVELLRQYVRLPTVAGREILGAEFLRQQLADAGVEATLEPLGEGSANLWALLEGESRETLVLHHHIDVSPVGDAADWLFPPFDATVEGPWLYGRGAFDMKSYAIAQLAAFLDVAASERPRRRSLMLLATSDEESDSRLGTQWLLWRHPELAERMWTVFTEGGTVEALSAEEIKYWGIEAFQFQLVRARACSPSRARLEALVADLGSWPANDVPPVVTPELATFFADYAPTRSRRLTRLHLASPEELLVNRRGLDRLPTFARDLMRSSVSAWPIEAAAGGGFSVAINLLLAPGADVAETVSRLLPEWVRHGVAWRIEAPEGSTHGSPVDSPAFRAAAATLARAHPETVVGSHFLPYNITDARFFRRAGIDTYGLSTFLFFTTDTIRADRTNERVPLPGFVSGVELYKEIVRRLVLDGEGLARE
jgi:acetylornithine deacetylase/succinyl-diaminopimelate desuccinylase-like protein